MPRRKRAGVIDLGKTGHRRSRLLPPLIPLASLMTRHEPPPIKAVA